MEVFDLFLLLEVFLLLFKSIIGIFGQKLYPSIEKKFL